MTAWVRPDPDAVALRTAALTDCERIWHWRNDPDTRRASFDERQIPLAEHRSWFESAVTQADRRLYVVLVGGVEAGVVRLDREGADATVHVNLAPEFRGRGIGSTALRLAVDRAAEDLGVESVVARVKADNVGSRRAFERAGFRTIAAGDPVTVAAPAAGRRRVAGSEASAADALGASLRLESLWRSEFGREYTERNAGQGELRGRFWSGLLAELHVQRVLEVGCNVGLNLRWIAPRVEFAVGIDVNEYPLPKLRADVPGVRAAAAAARALPFGDGAFDLVFTMGVLIHHAPALLPAAMTEIVRVADRYVLCGEYYADTVTEVAYRGQDGALFKQDFGGRYQELFPTLRLLARGRLLEADGWDDVTVWLLEKPRSRPA